MNDELKRIEREDPTVCGVFIAEYYFLKGDYKKAVDLFTALYEDPALSPTMKSTVRNYLVFASRALRAQDIEHLGFKITVDYNNGEQIVTIDKQNFPAQLHVVGPLLEVLDYYVKKHNMASGG